MIFYTLFEQPIISKAFFFILFSLFGVTVFNFIKIKSKVLHSITTIVFLLALSLLISFILGYIKSLGTDISMSYFAGKFFINLLPPVILSGIAISFYRKKQNSYEEQDNNSLKDLRIEDVSNNESEVLINNKVKNKTNDIIVKIFLGILILVLLVFTIYTITTL